MVVKFEGAPKKPTKQAQVLAALDSATQALTAVAAMHKPAMLKEKTEGQIIADELIQLDLKMKELDFATITKKHKELKDKLQLIAKDSPPNEQVTFEGDLGIVTLTPAADKKVVKDPLVLVQSLLEKFGPEATETVITIGLTALGKILSGAEIDAVTVTEPGSRTCKINPKAQ